MSEWVCLYCGEDADAPDHGRSADFGCFIDPTPAEQWQVTTPKEVYA